MAEILRQDNPNSNYNTYDMYKAAARAQENVLGSMTYFYTPEFVEVFNEAMVSDNKWLFSKEQEKYIDKYFTEADGQLSAEMLQLDKFLGEYTYIGEENG